MTSFKVAIMGVAAMALSGCATLTHFNKTEVIEDDNDQPILVETAVDAKQRVILSARQWDSSAPTPEPTAPGEGKLEGNWSWRHCAEPSPDVFSVLAASLDGEGTFGLSPTEKQLAASLKGSFSEGASTINRTQTVNLLREMMYRTCERFMNGAYSTDEFTVQAIRDQRAIVAILAIEQLTGSVQTSSRLGSAGGVGDASKVVEILDGALKVADEAQTAAAKAKTAYDGQAATAFEEKDGKKVCKTGSDGDDCRKKKTALDDAEKTAKDKRSHYEALLAVASKGAGGLSATAGGSSQTTTLVNYQPSGTDIAAVAASVENIVEAAYQKPEIELLCIRAILDPSNEDAKGAFDKWPALQNICEEAFRASILISIAERAKGASTEESTALADRAGVSAPAATQSSPPPASATTPRLYIQYGAKAQQAAAAALRDALQADPVTRGGSLRVMEGLDLVPSAPDKNQVRYYFAGDLPAAQSVANLIRKQLGAGEMIEVVQVSTGGKKVAFGTLEFWFRKP